MNKDMKEKPFYCLPIRCFGGDSCLRLFFKNKYDMSFFTAALAVEEYHFEDIVNCFGIPMNTPFNSSKIDGYPDQMTLQEAKDKGFRLFVFKENITDGNILLALQSLTLLFYPEKYAKSEIVSFWTCNDLKFYFVPPSEQSDRYVDHINFEFDKAVYNVMKVFDVKEQNGLVYLQPKNRFFNSKKMMALVGLKLMDFDLENSAYLLPNGKLMAVNKRDETLLLTIRQMYQKPSLKDLFFAKKVKGSKQKEM